MAAKRTKHFLTLICIVLAPILTSGCSRHNPRSAFEEANALFSQGDYQASLERYERIGEEHPSARDRVLFEMGIIHAHPKNGQRDYQKAVDVFQTLIKDYPESAYRQNSETMIFTIGNVGLKDGTIATQQAKIEALQQEVEGRESEIRTLQKQIESLERKHFAYVLEKGSADRILIEKKERRLTLLSKGEVLKTYRIALGGDPVGPKERQGDSKTPEGTYVIDARNRDSRYHLSLHISYPNERDKKRARALGVSPGGDIMIHGLGNGYSWVGDAHAEVDWTRGCIAVTDEEIGEIARLAPNGTVVEIRP
jgi:L,D-peptidoglycan transpeptidase YkuD (ErfK/YbiS/YcfS/YnhG family)